jgi:hypothetical protein
MSYAETILPEFEQEMASTRKVLERVPEEKWGWKAHAKSNTIGWNANHVAEIPGWAEGTRTQPSWDFAPVGGERYRTPSFRTQQEILNFFDRNVAAARKAIQEVKDDTERGHATFKLCRLTDLAPSLDRFAQALLLPGLPRTTARGIDSTVRRLGRMMPWVLPTRTA